MPEIELSGSGELGWPTPNSRERKQRRKQEEDSDQCEVSNDFIIIFILFIFCGKKYMDKSNFILVWYIKNVILDLPCSSLKHKIKLRKMTESIYKLKINNTKELKLQ